VIPPIKTTYLCSQTYNLHIAMHRQLLLFAILLMGISALSAQKPTGFWKEVPNESISVPENGVREFEPDAYFTYQLDYEGIRQRLTQAPSKFGQSNFTLQMPQADGTIETFVVSEYRLVTEALWAKYPLLRSYQGYALNDPSKVLRITVSPEWGMKAAIRRGDKGFEYIERAVKGHDNYYMVYDHRAFPENLKTKGFITQDMISAPNQIPERGTDRATVTTLPGVEDRGLDVANDVKVKIYRFACAATGEFSQDHGGTKASVLAAMVDYVAKLNAIYETDLDIRLILVDNVESILFLDPATDPYTGTSVGEWMSQNPVAMIQTIGFDSYEIGHVFARYQGGSAIGVAGGQCCTDFKGRGCSSANLPYGAYFLSIIGQEIGHQWSGGHTWAYCGDPTQGGLGPGDAPGVACEPGSGSTIMSYAGACGNGHSVQSTADLYYHVCSIKEIRQFVEIGVGSTCGSEETIDNRAPVVTIPYRNGIVIPKSTPFELTGSATDPDGEPVTYCWEQADTGPLVPPGSPTGNTPLFRTFPPTTSPSRTFPRIQSVVASQNPPTFELLPTYTRDLTFCLTARDNHPGGGGVGIDTVELKVTANAGPFRVTYPSATNITWHPGEYQDVTWSVASTDVSPVNCKIVNIRLSKDGGLTYPITLATGVPNNGKACVLVPNESGSAFRIRVDAADNVFFDISNSNFKIEAATTPGYAICIGNVIQQACLPNIFNLNVGSSAWAGFNSPVSYAVLGLPSTATANFSASPAPAGDDVTLSMDLSTTPEGVYNMTVVSEANGITDSASFSVKVVSNDFSSFALTTPADGSQQTQLPILRWVAQPDANRYEVQIATTPTFAAGTLRLNRNDVLVDSLIGAANLQKATVYYWRVRALNECGDSGWAGPFAFVTQSDACNVYTSGDLPKNIPASSVNPVEAIIPITGGTISDVNVKNIKLFHDAFSQLDVSLVSPAGTSRFLFKQKCGFSSITMDAGFDDGAAITIFPCPPNGGQIIKPSQALSQFNGEQANGNWKLVVKDNEVGSGGAINSIELEVCSAVAVNAPTIVENNLLTLTPGTNALIPNTLLKAQDSDNTADQLVFTITVNPKGGTLFLEGVGDIGVGAQFSQSDIDNGKLRYYDYGASTTTDAFRFSVSDGAGGLVTGTFLISAVVGTKDLANSLEFGLAPNPTKGSVVVSFGNSLRSDAVLTIGDLTGRVLSSIVVAANTNQTTVDLRSMPAGTYLVTVRTNDGTASRKLIRTND
jgi:subtilisin-like proprotein convertase family protein